MGLEPDDPAASSAEGGQDTAGERTSGLTLETCYRHADVVTGVHCTRCGRPICTDCMNPAPIGYQCPQCVAEARRGGGHRRARIVLGRPGRVTSSLLALNIAMFVVEVAVGASQGLWTGGDSAALLKLGGLQPIFVAEGHQYWRLISSMFLHAGLLHIAFNMYALYLFGYVIEDAFGPVRFTAIYFVSGFLAGATSFAFSDPTSLGVGASGAIFGLLGTWIAYNYRRRTSALGQANLRMALMLVGINLFLGFTIPHIDNYAHIGGLFSGIIAGWFAEGFGPRRLRPWVQAAGLAGLVLLGVAMVAWRTATFPSIPLRA